MAVPCDLPTVRRHVSALMCSSVAISAWRVRTEQAQPPSRAVSAASSAGSAPAACSRRTCSAAAPRQRVGEPRRPPGGGPHRGRDLGPGSWMPLGLDRRGDRRFIRGTDRQIHHLHARVGIPPRLGPSWPPQSGIRRPSGPHVALAPAPEGSPRDPGGLRDDLDVGLAREQRGASEQVVVIDDQETDRGVRHAPGIATAAPRRKRAHPT